MNTSSKKDLKQLCIELMNQNQSLNQMFDSSASLHNELEAYFRNQTLPLYSDKKKEFYEYQRYYHSYIFSLLEDIHRYSHFTLCEIYLYKERLEHKDDKDFFSSNYFLRNCTFHITGAWERIFRISSLIYGFDFSGENWERSKNLYDFLKNTDSFNVTEIYHIIKELKANGNLPEIEKIRIRNDHQLSMHVDFETDDQLMKYAKICYENAKALYKIIDIYIKMFQKQCFLQTKKIDFKKFNWDQNLETHIEPIVTKELQKELLISRLNNSNDYINKGIQTFIDLKPVINPSLVIKNEYSIYILHHSDIIWRLHEAIRSLQYSYKLIISTKQYGTEFHEQEVYFPNIDYSYFIESAVIRIYSVYDKIATLLHYYTGLGKAKNTFEQFMRNNTESTKNMDLLELANSIFHRQEYKELNKLRQDNLHHMVKENFIHRSDSEWSTLYNMVLASKNIEFLKPLVNKILDLFIIDLLESK